MGSVHVLTVFVAMFIRCDVAHAVELPTRVCDSGASGLAGNNSPQHLSNDEQDFVSLQSVISNPVEEDERTQISQRFELTKTVNSFWVPLVIGVYGIMVSIVLYVFLRRNKFQLKDEATPHLRPLVCDRNLHYIHFISPFLLVLFISKLTDFNLQFPGLHAAILFMPVSRLFRTFLTDPGSLWKMGLWSGKNPYVLVSEVKDIFIAVHPVTNDALCLTHIISYWPGILKFFQGSLCDYLFWASIMMIFSPYTESLHIYTAPVDAARRSAFIGKRKRHFVDEMVRNEMGPFLVYFVLLPKYLCELTARIWRLRTDTTPSVSLIVFVDSYIKEKRESLQCKYRAFLGSMHAQYAR